MKTGLSRISPLLLSATLTFGQGPGFAEGLDWADEAALLARIAHEFKGAEGTFQHERLVLRASACARLVSFLRLQRAHGDRDAMARCLVRLGEGDLMEFRRYFEEEFASWRDYPTAPGVKPVVLNVRDFGATGNGEADDAEAFARAVDAIRALGGAPSVLRIPPGTYLLKSPSLVDGRRPFNLDASSLTNCIVEGASPESTALVFGTYNASGVSFDRAKNATLRNVHLYYAETPFSQTKVLSFDKAQRWAVVRHEPGTLKPTDARFRQGSQRTQCCGQFDADGKQLYGQANVFFSLQAEDLGDGLYRVHFADHPSWRHVDVPVGSILVLPDRDNRYQAIRATDARLCNFENVWISNSRSGAFTVAGGWMITGWKCRVRPRAPNLVLSTNADAFFNSRGTHLAHCDFGHMNDDGANSFAPGRMIRSISEDRRSIVHAPGVRRRNPGDRVALIRPTDGRYLAVLEIASSTTRKDGEAECGVTTFTERIPDEVRSMDDLGMGGVTSAERQEIVRGFKSPSEFPDQVYFPMAQGVGYVVVDNDFHDLRNIAIQVQCPNAIIAGNRISRVAKAISMSCLTDWIEGPAPYNVSIRDNEISEVVDGIRTSFRLAQGASSAETPFRGIELANNVMTNLPLARHAILLRNAKDVTVRGVGRECVEW